MTSTGYRAQVSSPPWYICKELVLVSASIRTKSINQRETALTHGIRVQMISCSWHWEKGPAGGEILSGRLLTLPLARAPPPSYQYLRFSLLNKTIVIDDTLMEAIPLTLDQFEPNSCCLLCLGLNSTCTARNYYLKIPTDATTGMQGMRGSGVAFLPNYENINVTFFGR